jgi:hypothetical protein
LVPDALGVNAGALVPIVSAASLGFLALLVRSGQRTGGAKRSARYGPSDILGRAGDGSNRRYREMFRHGSLKIGSAEEIQNIGPELT